MNEKVEGNLPQTKSLENNVEEIRQALNEIILAIEKYDKEHSWGTMAAEAMVSAIDEKIPPHERTPKKHKVSFKEIREANTNNLQLTGLSIEPVKNKNVTLMGTMNTEDGLENISANPKELRVNINDRKIFLNCLNQFNEKNISENDAKNLLSATVQCTTLLKLR